VSVHFFVFWILQVTIPSRYVATGQPGALKAGLEALCEAAADAAKAGAQVSIIPTRRCNSCES
jgi:hypothetical protein